MADDVAVRSGGDEQQVVHRRPEGRFWASGINLVMAAVFLTVAALMYPIDKGGSTAITVLALVLAAAAGRMWREGAVVTSDQFVMRGVFLTRSFPRAQVTAVAAEPTSVPLVWRLLAGQIALSHEAVVVLGSRRVAGGGVAMRFMSADAARAFAEDLRTALAHSSSRPTYRSREDDTRA